MSVRGHGVAVLRTGTLVAAWHVNTLVRAQVAHALGTLIDVWGGGEKLSQGTSIPEVVGGVGGVCLGVWCCCLPLQKVSTFPMVLAH